MPTTRVMPFADLAGSTVNSLRVGLMISRHPRPKYETTCQRCGTHSTASQDRLTSGAARCLAANCGKAERTRGRDRLSETRQQITERENQRHADELAASQARMESETADYQRPERYTPAPEPPIMTERDRRSLREFREEQEAEQRRLDAPRIEAERKAAEAQEAAAAAKRLRAEGQRKYWAEWVQSDPDPKLFVSDAMRNAKMPTKDAEAFTVKAAQEFAETPEFASYRTLENADAILGYLRRNGVFIADVETIRAAFHRLRDLGVLKAKATPQPQPVERPTRVNLEIAPAPKPTPSGPKTYVGRDYATGEERTFTQREVDRMSSLEFQRAFQIVPTVSELFTRMSEN